MIFKFSILHIGKKKKATANMICMKQLTKKEICLEMNNKTLIARKVHLT